MNHTTIHLNEHFPALGQNGCDPTLSLYLPYNMTEMNRQDQKRPAILLCPGGGYGMVSQREGEPIALRFLPKGYNVFMLTYSVAPNKFPTQIREVAAAMELIHANADRWNTDPERIAIMGFSAGGHLAGHYSNCFDCPEVRELFPDSKPVKASILCYPVITADPAMRHTGSFVNLSGHDLPTEEDIEKFSLDKCVTDHTPPAFLWHTTEDNCVPVMNSLLYAQALTQHKIPYSLNIYPFGWHGLATVDDETNGPLSEKIHLCEDWMDTLMKWLKVTL